MKFTFEDKICRNCGEKNCLSRFNEKIIPLPSGWDYRVEVWHKDSKYFLPKSVAKLYRTEEFQKFTTMDESPTMASDKTVLIEQANQDDKIPVHSTPEGKLYIKASDLFALPRVQELIHKVAEKQITKYK